MLEKRMLVPLAFAKQKGGSKLHFRRSYDIMK